MDLPESASRPCYKVFPLASERERQRQIGRNAVCVRGKGWSVGLKADGVEIEEVVHGALELPTGLRGIESAHEQLA